ncbi:MAG: SDR family oxidoreductase [Acidobacteria bacterium]|nr:SDR family oxidoreductase [Acidobacteriota bacterium]
MSQQLASKTALITGAANGIGREIAQRFAAEGARIVSLDTDEAGNAQTAALIRASGGTCEPVAGDVSVAADVERAFRLAGPVDILVNNAAVWSGDGFLHQVSEADWDRILAVCLKGVFLCAREALRGMLERRTGVIVNIASVNALAGIHLAAYTAAKGGIVSLTRLLAVQYARSGIRVNVICPATILTESSRRYYAEHPGLEADLRALYPAGMFGVPADVAECALFLASDRSAFINGAVLVLDGGMTAGYRVGALGVDPA